MNTDPNNTIKEKELEEWRRRDIHWSLPVLGLLFLLMLVTLWALLFRLPDRDNTAGNGGKGLGEIAGDGRGNGNGGNGDGSGKGTGSGSDSGNQQGNNTNPDKNHGGSSKPKPDKPQGNKGDSKQGKNSPEPPPPPKHIQYYKAEKQPPKANPPKSSRPGKSGNNSGGSDFYGSNVYADGKILFLIDTSGSMSYSMEVLKRELRKAVFLGDRPNEKTYKRNGGFVIIEFNHEVKRYPDQKLYRYPRKNSMLEAEKTINSLTSGGGTYMRKAWEAALPVVIAEKITTVYFLSDGYSGDAFTAQWLCDELKKNSRTKMLKINCIAIGYDNEEMKKLAQACDGDYLSLK
jgi:uncharacterized protein YegL